MWLKKLACMGLLLILGCSTASSCCNRIDLDEKDRAAMEQLFKERGFGSVKVDDESKFYRLNGKLMAKVIVHFEYKPLYEVQSIDNLQHR